MDNLKNNYNYKIRQIAMDLKVIVDVPQGVLIGQDKINDKNNLPIIYIITRAVEKIAENNELRHYHSMENHIIPMLLRIKDVEENVGHRKLLFWAILFHDAIYDFKATNGKNERDSAELWRYLSYKTFDKNGNGPFKFENVNLIFEMILATYGHESQKPSVRKFLKMDLNGFTQPFNLTLEDELKIRKEYNFVNWSTYQKGRIDFLNKFINNSIIQEMGVANILKMQAEYMMFIKPKIAVFPGTFEFWHVGHHEVLQKLEAIFDKVIIVFAINTDKKISSRKVPKILETRQVEFVEGSLMKYIESLTYPVTIARGLRNGTDLLAEQAYFHWLGILGKKDIKTIAVFADPLNEYISSSALKSIKAIDEEQFKAHVYE